MSDKEKDAIYRIAHKCVTKVLCVSDNLKTLSVIDSLAEYASIVTKEKDEELKDLGGKYIDYVELQFDHNALKQEADKLAEALEVYLTAGHKEARRQASIIAKQALTNYKGEK